MLDQSHGSISMDHEMSDGNEDDSDDNDDEDEDEERGTSIF